MNHHRILVILLVLTLFTAACNAHRVRSGTLRDTIFSVEETNNGYYRVWMTHDDIAGYCTQNRETGQYALHLLRNHNGEVLLDFRSINEGDPEHSWWNSSDCGSISSGDSTTAMFYLVSVVPVPARDSLATPELPPSN